MLPVEQPFKTYTGLDGKPLDNGYVYFGQPNQNPITHPVTVYWDAAGTIPAAQPLRTVNGYIMRAGTPANVFFDGAYSETVLDSKKRQVFYARTSDEFSIVSAVYNFIANLAASAGSSLMGFIQAGVSAVKRTVQDKLREAVSVTDFGAKGDGITDDTAAFEAVLAAYGGKRIYVPPGTYKLTRSLTILGGTEFYGDGAASVLLQYTDDIPILYAQSERTKIHSLQLKYNALQAGKPWGNAIHCQLLYESVIDRLLIINAYEGIYSKRYTTSDTDETGNFIYSCTISNLRIAGYAGGGMLLSSINQGNSGNILSNIYVLNRNGGGFNTTSSGVVIENMDDGVIEQLNIEHAIHTGPSLVINTCNNLTIKGLHFEGIRCATDYIGLVDVLNSRASVTGMSMCFNYFTAANLYALFRLGSGSVITSNIVERDNTYTSANRPVFYSVNGTCFARHLGLQLLQKTTIWHTGLTQTPPVLLESGYESQYVGTQYVATSQNVGWNNNQTFAQSVNQNGNNITEWRRFQGSIAYIANAGGSGAAPNAADTVFGVYASAATGRSINAGGTVNTGGADYAEYMHKAPGAGAIAKGGIVAITAKGEVTDNLGEGVAFAVKSTDPSFVGGDKWAAHLPRPAEPVKIEVPFNPENDDWEKAEAQHQAALAQHAVDVKQWEIDYENLRKTVDRIAFSGQVPVNVVGATPGDYILPDGSGTRWNLHADPEVPDWFKKFERAVGKVIAIEADGRARIVVKQPS